MRPGQFGLWNGNPELEMEFMALMTSFKDASVVVNSMLTHFQLVVLLQLRKSDLLRENERRYLVSRNFVKASVQMKLRWTFWKATSKAIKLPFDWRERGNTMVLRITYMVKAYDIPLELVVNADQTGLQLNPVGNEETFSMKGAREVLISGKVCRICDGDSCCSDALRD